MPTTESSCCCICVRALASSCATHYRCAKRDASPPVVRQKWRGLGRVVPSTSAWRSTTHRDSWQTSASTRRFDLRQRCRRDRVFLFLSRALAGERRWRRPVHLWIDPVSVKTRASLAASTPSPSCSFPARRLFIPSTVARSCRYERDSRCCTASSARLSTSQRPVRASRPCNAHTCRYRW